MMEFFVMLENLPLSAWVRESGSLLAYPTILFLHTVGLGIVAGLSAAMSLRALGIGSEIPLAPLESFFPVLWGGFWLNAGSGVLLLIADATTKLTNPVFYVKMGFVAAGIVTTSRLRRAMFRNPATRALVPAAKIWGGLCLACWAGAITAGRLMAYLGPVSGIADLSITLGR
jgi:hypothetical protein